MNVHENYGRINRPVVVMVLIGILLLLGFLGRAQTKTVINNGSPNQIYKWPVTATDSAMYLPKGCNAPPAPTNYQVAYRGPMIYMDTCNTVLYVYNPHLGSWGAIANAADLSAYLRISDTASMLSHYLLSNVAAATYIAKQAPSVINKYLQPDGTAVDFPLVVSYFSNDAGYLTSATAGPIFTAYVNTTSDLQALTGTANTCIVMDSKVGGVFYLANGVYTADNALIFAATGRGAGYYWFRQITESKYYAAWWGIDSTNSSTANQRALNTMFNGMPRGARVYFERGNKLLTDSTVYVHGKSGLWIDGLNSNRDSSRTYLTNFVFDTCNNLTITNSRFWGASAFNADATRRSGLILQHSDYFHLDNLEISHYKKNGLEVLSCSYGNGYNLHMDSCSRDGISLSPAQYCNFYNCTNINSALGGMEFSDSTNNCGLYYYTSIATLYVFDKDYHIAGQSNSDNTVDHFTAINCGAVVDHGTPATSTVVEKNWRITNGTVIGGTGATGHGDFFWATNTQNVVFQNITIRRPQYTGQAVFQISNTDGLVFDNILFPDSLNNNGIRCTGGGPFAIPYANGITITNCQARNLKSTTSNTFAVSVDFANHVKISGNIFTGIPTYGGNGISISTVNDINVIANTSDSMPNGYGVLLGASVDCNGGNVLNNYCRTTQRAINFSGTHNMGVTVIGNITPDNNAGLQTVSQAYPWRNDNGMLFDPRARSLNAGNVISQGTDTSYTLYLISNQKSHIFGAFYDAAHGYTVSVDASGNVTVSNTSGGTTQTISAATTIAAGAFRLNATEINSNIFFNSGNGAASTTYSNAAFKPSIDANSWNLRGGTRGGQTLNVAPGLNGANFAFATQGITTAATGTHNLIGGYYFLPPSITSGGATVNDAFSVGFFNAPTGGTRNWTTWTTGTERHDGLFASGTTTLTANQVWAANPAGTAMTGATVEQLSVPKVVASAILTGQTATTNVVTYTTGAADSTFDISGRITVTAYTSGNVQLTVNYTDETSTSRTGTFYPMGSATAALSAAGASNFPVLGSIRVKASTTITVIATVTGTLTFNAAAKIIKLP